MLVRVVPANAYCLTLCNKESRAKKMDFSDPHREKEDGPIIWVHGGNSIRSIEDPANAPSPISLNIGFERHKTVLTDRHMAKQESPRFTVEFSIHTSLSDPK
jgi:hypothetical protein